MSTVTTHIVKKKSLTPMLRYKKFKDDWAIWRLEEVCVEIFLGLTSKVDYVTEGGFPFIRASNITTGRLLFDDVLSISEEQHKKLTKKRLTKRGDILVNKSGSLGTCIIVDTDREFSTYESIITIQPTSNLVLNTYLLQVLQDERTQNRMLGNKVGSIVGHLNLLAFRKLNVPIPSLPEQQRIASFLSAVDEKIQQLTRKKELLGRYKKGVMQQIFSGKLRFEDEKGKPYPKWVKDKLGKYLTYKSERNRINQVNLVLSVSNKRGFITQDEQFDGYEVASKDLTNYKIVSKNDIAYNPSRINVGSIARLLNYSNGIVSPMYVVFSLKDNINPSFFDCLCSTHRFKYLVKMGCSGSVRDTLNYEVLEDFIFDFPSIEEQLKIANFLTAIDLKIESVSKQIERTQDFKKGLLQQMFV